MQTLYQGLLNVSVTSIKRMATQTGMTGAEDSSLVMYTGTETGDLSRMF